MISLVVRSSAGVLKWKPSRTFNASSARQFSSCATWIALSILEKFEIRQKLFHLCLNLFQFSHLSSPNVKGGSGLAFFLNCAAVSSSAIFVAQCFFLTSALFEGLYWCFSLPQAYSKCLLILPLKSFHRCYHVKSGITNDVLISTDLFGMLQCCLLCPTHESIMLPVAGCVQSYVGTNVSRSDH